MEVAHPTAVGHGQLPKDAEASWRSAAKDLHPAFAMIPEATHDARRKSEIRRMGKTARQDAGPKPMMAEFTAVVAQ